MKPIQYLFISFLGILLAGALLFFYQTQRLAELERHAEVQSAAAVTAAPSRIPASRSVDPASKTAHPASLVFLGKLKDALANSLTKNQVEALLNPGDAELGFESLVTAANLTGDEREAVRRGLKQFDGHRAELYLNRSLSPAALADELLKVKGRREAWLAAQLGKERYEAVVRCGERQARASAERRAAASVSRISSAADLSQAQKDALYAGFLDLNLNPPSSAGNKLTVETFANLKVEPSVPDLSEDAEKILTEEQLRLYQLQKKTSAQTLAARSQGLMGITESLIPTVMNLLETGQ